MNEVINKNNSPPYWSIPLALVLLMLLAEISIRGSATSLSDNIKHIRNIPAVTRQLAELGNTSQSSLVFVGNSLTGDAVNLAQFNERINNHPGNLVQAYKITPDATSIWDWYCIVSNNFTHTHTAPNVVVIGFGWEQLSDSEIPRPSRLATHFCSMKDLPELVSLGMKDTSDIFEYISASASVLYALREPIRKRVLDIFIPYYREYAGKVNRPEHIDKSNAIQEKYSYMLLNKLLSTCKENNIIPVFIAMPVKQYYSLDTTLIETLNAHSALLLDYRNMINISNEMYKDDIHLNDAGSIIFTDRAAQDINNLLNMKTF